MHLKMQVITPYSLGSDRIAGCIAAINNFPNCNIILVDLGTTTVFDIILKGNIYLGGVILPGLRLSLDALCLRVAQLSSVKLEVPKLVIGRDTDTNIQSGLYYGHIGAIKEIKNQIFNELNTTKSNFITVGTGGLVKFFNHTKLFDIVIPNLVLQGIKAAFEKYADL